MRRRQGTRGFTLIEILVSLVILALVITTSLAVFFERERRLRRAESVVLVYQALANEAEVRRRTPYGMLTPGEKVPFASDTPILLQLKDAEAEVTVEQTRPDVRLVTMTIRWNKGTQSAAMAVVRTETGGSSLW